jgi:integrase/recombinase XerD
MRTKRTITPAAVRVTGPLAEFAAGFSEELRARGYTEVSAWHHLRLCAQFSTLLAQAHLSASEISTDEIDGFLRARRAANPTGLRTVRALAPLLGYLERLGVVTDLAAPAPDGTFEVLLDRYRTYLVRERGLAARTVAGYTATARLFLAGRMVDEGAGLAGLSGADLTTFVLREHRRRGVGSTKYLVTGLRSLLRFLHLEGLAPELADAVPTVAGWSGAALPHALGPGQVERLLTSCDPETAAGRRDRALLVLLVRLGLRAGEAAGLTLDAIDWRRGELVIAGKGGRHERLPLPVDVGEAIAAYLRAGRPPSRSRHVFLRTRAPFDAALTVGGVTSAVRRACARADITPAGAHRLRHTAATEMLRAGASLADVAQVLRHRGLATTAIYAKVDRRALRELARPWPGGVA